MTDIPKLTDAEAMILRVRLQHPAMLAKANARITMLGLDDDESVYVGEQALAAYDAQRRAETLANFHRPRPFSEWCEDDGDVLWFVLPIEEPPYCGTPNSEGWPWIPMHHEHLHWCRLPVIFFCESIINALLAKEAP